MDALIHNSPTAPTAANWSTDQALRVLTTSWLWVSSRTLSVEAIESERQHIALDHPPGILAALNTLHYIVLGHTIPLHGIRLSGQTILEGYNQLSNHLVNQASRLHAYLGTYRP